MVSTDTKTYLDILKASYIYFVKIIVSNLTTEGNLNVYVMAEEKTKVCVSDILHYRTNQEVCMRVVA